MDVHTLWEVVQGLVALIAFGAGSRHRRQRLGPTNVLDGVGYFEDTTLSLDDSSVSSLRAGAPLRVPMAFKLTFDRMDTGNASGPQWQPWAARTEIACKDARLLDLLRATDAVSSAIAALVANGVTTIVADGEMLWMYRNSRELADHGSLAPLFRLRDALEPVSKQVRTGATRVRVQGQILQGMRWFFITYAATSVLALVVDVRAPYVDVFRHAEVATLVSLMLLAAVAALVMAMFGRSVDLSALFPIAPVAVLSVLGVVAAGFALTSALNRHLDLTPPIVMTKRIVDVDLHARDEDDALDYLVNIFRPPQCDIAIERAADDPVRLPATIEVPAAIFCRAPPPGRVEFEIGRGALGVAWYRRITAP